MRILIAEDDTVLADGLTKALRAFGYSADCVRSGTDAEAAISTQQFDLAILDVGLPGKGGFEVLQRMRSQQNTTPVMMLTALDGVEHRVKGLNLGADDYLVKPFALEELEARVRALTRRAAGRSSTQIDHGVLSYDTVKRCATINGELLDLSARETALLEIFLTRVGRVVSKEQVIDLLCEWGDEVTLNAVEVYVYRLRKKIEPANAGLRTLRGLGYILDKPNPEPLTKAST